MDRMTSWISRFVDVPRLSFLPPSLSSTLVLFECSGFRAPTYLDEYTAVNWPCISAHTPHAE